MPKDTIAFRLDISGVGKAPTTPCLSAISADPASHADLRSLEIFDLPLFRALQKPDDESPERAVGVPACVCHRRDITRPELAPGKISLYARQLGRRLRGRFFHGLTQS